MSYSIYTNEYLGFTDTETVSYFDGATTTTGVTARMVEPEEKELAMYENAGISEENATLILFTATLSSKIPKAPGKITLADSSTWYIIDVKKQRFGTQYRCLCRKGV